MRAALIFFAAVLTLVQYSLGEEPAVSVAVARPDSTPSSLERLQFSDDDLPSLEKDPAGPSEIDESALREGFNYAKGTRRAAHGDSKALKKFFEVAQHADGAAAESIGGVPTVVYHILGDEKFAAFLAAEPLSYQAMVRNIILGDGRIPSIGADLQRNFPKTSELLFRREIVAWFSPDGRYAIHKLFSDPLPLMGSKVERAELIEKETGRVLVDLTSVDIGVGAERQGEVLWAPDSKRFAYLSCDLTEGTGNLFSKPRAPLQKKQTVVYQVLGDSFARVELPFAEVPGRGSDTELSDAVLGHDYIEPVRWHKPTVLVLNRHEYYEKLVPMLVGQEKFDTIHPFSRSYQITARIAADGKATLAWKRQQY
jgi:hypothetical protein